MTTIATYAHRPEETLLEKCARLKAELQAAARMRTEIPAANDNERGRKPMWWEKD